MHTSSESSSDRNPVEALADESETKARRDILVTALLFVAGFSTVFVGLGATASALGELLRQWSHALSIAAGIGVILMGLHFLGVFRIGAMLREKRLEISLTYVFGIGRSKAQLICEQTEIDPNTRVRDLTDEEVTRLRNYIDANLQVEGDLRRDVSQDIKRKMEIGC